MSRNGSICRNCDCKVLYCPPMYKFLNWNCWKFWSWEMKYHHSSVVESKSFHHSWLGFASSLVMKWFWFNSRLVMIFHFSTPEFSATVHFLPFQKWPKINFWTGKKFKTAKMQFSRKIFLIYLISLVFLPGLF